MRLRQKGLRKRKRKNTRRFFHYLSELLIMQDTKLRHSPKNRAKTTVTHLCLSYADDLPFSLVQPLQHHEPDNKIKKSQNPKPYFKSFCCVLCIHIHDCT